MNEALLIFIASLISVIASTALTYWMNRKKVQPEINKIQAETKLTGGEIASKYQQIANTQADTNIELSRNNMQLKQQIEILQTDVEELKKARIADREEFRKSFEEERTRNQKILDEERARADKFENYSNRLEFQLRSWEIVPIPYNLTEFKESKKACIDGAELISEK